MAIGLLDLGAPHCVLAPGGDDAVSDGRERDPEAVMDAAEELVAGAGVRALTTRALIEATGMSNGGLYRTFGSRAGLMGRMWVRAERRFLAMLISGVDQIPGAGGQDAWGAALAAAEAAVLFPQLYPGSAALLAAVGRQDLSVQSLPAEMVGQLCVLDEQRRTVIARLARWLWQRDDDGALDLVRTCVVDLPNWLALQARYRGTPVTADYLRDAVAGLLKIAPPPPALGRMAVPSIDGGWLRADRTAHR